MANWLDGALDYIPRWLDFQLRLSEQPGCVIAVAEDGKIVLERAFGVADLATGAALTPRHRFRVASHSKSFTAAGIMKLREEGRLRLDDPAGRYVPNLHKEVAAATIAQLLSHGAGIVRDGADTGQWQDRRPFLRERELRAALRAAPVIPGSTRFKYSNHGYGLAGLVIEAVTGERYADWIARTIVAPAGLRETTPDMPVSANATMASGHSGKLPLGRRIVVPGTNPTNALAPATGFVSTAADLARFFGQLDPAAKRSVLSAASRREMVRRLWRDPQTAVERHYGLGLMSGRIGEWDWFGHSGGFQGFISRTVALPERGLAVSIVTNAVDGYAWPWLDGIVHVLRAFSTNGPPSAALRSWSGRWWSLWGALDLVPMGKKVMVAAPGLLNPLQDASELVLTGKDTARVALAVGGASHGEPVSRLRRRGRVAEVRLAGTRLLPEAEIVAEIESRYGRS